MRNTHAGSRPTDKAPSTIACPVLASLLASIAAWMLSACNTFYPLDVPNQQALPTGTVGVPYSSYVKVAGGQAPIVYYFVDADPYMAPGLSLSGSTGNVYGTPTLAGKYQLNLEVWDQTIAHQPGVIGLPATVTVLIENPVPGITDIQPGFAAPGSTLATLTLNGTNFVPGTAVLAGGSSYPGPTGFSVVQWNGSPRTTTFVSPTQLTFTLEPGDLATAGSASITVVNPGPGGGTSNTVVFTISANGPPPPPANPVPVVTNLTPASATAGGNDFTLTVEGSDFIAGSVVQWNGSARTTTFVSATELTAAVSAADITTAGTASVTVVNPAPGGGTSGAVLFSINAAPPPPPAQNPVPAITTLNPSRATAGASSFSMTVNGSGFIPASVVQWNGSASSTTFINANQLSATISAADVANAGTASVTVVNPAPGGGASNASQFTIASAGNALNGNYGFLIQGFDNSTHNIPFAIAGHLQADGLGHITNLTEDIDREGLAANLTCTGTCSYTLSADGQGDLTLTTTQGVATYHFVLEASGRARLLETDTNGQSGFGVLVPQNMADFQASALNGGYAFAFSGIQADPVTYVFQRGVAVGVFQADGVSALGNGVFDYSVGSRSSVDAAFAGSFTAPDALTGRGTVTFKFPSPAGTRNFAYYMVDRTELYLVALDSVDSVGLLSGSILQQSGGPFSTASMSGPMVVSLSGQHVPGVSQPGPQGTSTLLGLVTYDGHASASGTVDAVQASTLYLNEVTSNPYTIAANGLGSTTIETPDFNIFARFCMVSPGRALMAGLYGEQLIGSIEAQTSGSFSNAMLSGPYALGTLAPGQSGVAGVSASMTPVAGTFAGTGVIATAPNLTDPADFTATVNVGADGRSPAGMTTANIPLAANAVAYMVSPTKLYLMSLGVNSSTPNAAIYVFEQ